jgi:hypothetical protein
MHTLPSLSHAKNRHQLLLLAALLVWLGVFPACTTSRNEAPPIPSSSWGDRYAYVYDPPQKGNMPPGSVPVNVAVVNPSYRESDSALMSDIYSKVAKGFTSSMGTDLDKILIAKGMTTTGPFPSLDEITYSEKKNAELTLAPKIFISTEIKYDKMSPTQRREGTTMEREFTMSISGWITFIMQEPLSGEKMWIKKLELEPMQVTGLEILGAVPQYRSDGCGGRALVGWDATDKHLYYGQTEAMAGALKQFYPVIMNAFQRYLDSDEMVQLKEKGKEIRTRKVY